MCCRGVHKWVTGYTNRVLFCFLSSQSLIRFVLVLPSVCVALLVDCRDSSHPTAIYVYVLRTGSTPLLVQHRHTTFLRTRLRHSHPSVAFKPVSFRKTNCKLFCFAQREAAEGRSKNESEAKKRVAENESSANMAEASYRAEAHVGVSGRLVDRLRLFRSHNL